MGMKKYLLMFAFILPLMAQDSTEVKEEVEQKKSWGKKAWMGLQDADWKKYNAAHDRAHNKKGGMKRGGKTDQRNNRMEIAKRREMHKKRAIRSFVRIVVIGGVAYYIGYLHGEKNHKGGWDRKPPMGDRK